MTELERQLRRELRRLEVPAAEQAHARSGEVVRAAFDQREPAARRRPPLRPVLVLATALALVAAAASPPGRAVIDTVREHVSGVEQARPALFDLPAEGRLLVDTPAGAWVVRRDGSKRLLADVRDPSWSPHGLYVVGVRHSELVALEPGGRTRWSLARPDVHAPSWGGTRTDTRIAYLSGTTLRVVAGDGTGDRLLARGAARVTPAWRPGEGHVVAYLDAAERIVVVDADSGRELWRSRFVEQAFALRWSDDGERLVAVKPRGLSVYDGSGRHVGGRSLPGMVTAAAFAPLTHRLAVVRTLRGRAELFIFEADALSAPARLVFHGEGRFTGVAWSPDAAWLLVAWADADQWVFVRSARVRGLDAVSDLSRQFGGAFPGLSGWCCAQEGETAPRATAVAAAPPAPPVRRAAAPSPPPVRAAAAPPAPPPLRTPAVVWRRSTPLGLPHRGTLVDGVELPREGATFFTWDPVRRVSPNPRWRRYGSDRVVRALLRILDEHTAAHPGAPRVGVGDLSRPGGGPFGPKHVSHQNGLDVDVYFPRLDRRERPPDRPEQIDRRLAQDLVDRFVAAGAVRVFVGPRTRLTGPPGVVQVLANHDNHLHARFPNRY